MSGAEVVAPIKARPDVPSATAEEPIAIHGPGIAVAATAAADRDTEAEREAAAEADALKDWAWLADAESD